MPRACVICPMVPSHPLSAIPLADCALSVVSVCRCATYAYTYSYVVEGTTGLRIRAKYHYHAKIM